MRSTENKGICFMIIWLTFHQTFTRTLDYFWHDIFVVKKAKLAMMYFSVLSRLAVTNHCQLKTTTDILFIEKH